LLSHNEPLLSSIIFKYQSVSQSVCQQQVIESILDCTVGLVHVSTMLLGHHEGIGKLAGQSSYEDAISL